MELGLGIEMEISARFLPFDITWSWEVSGEPMSGAWLSHLRGTAVIPGWSTKSLSSKRLRIKGRKKERKKGERKKEILKEVIKIKNKK